MSPPLLLRLGAIMADWLSPPQFALIAISGYIALWACRNLLDFFAGLLFSNGCVQLGLAVPEKFVLEDTIELIICC